MNNRIRLAKLLNYIENNARLAFFYFEKCKFLNYCTLVHECVEKQRFKFFFE